MRTHHKLAVHNYAYSKTHASKQAMQLYLSTHPSRHSTYSYKQWKAFSSEAFPLHNYPISTFVGTDKSTLLTNEARHQAVEDIVHRPTSKRTSCPVMLSTGSFWWRWKAPKAHNCNAKLPYVTMICMLCITNPAYSRRVGRITNIQYSAGAMQLATVTRKSMTKYASHSAQHTPHLWASRCSCRNLQSEEIIQTPWESTQFGYKKQGI